MLCFYKIKHVLIFLKSMKADCCNNITDDLPILTSQIEFGSIIFSAIFWNGSRRIGVAAAAAKSLQSCPTLCNPIDSSPPGSPVPGILQARTLEWIAISFSNA